MIAKRYHLSTASNEANFASQDAPRPRLA
jgi:hypothetical protein